MIADDHLLVAEALQAILNPEFEVVGIVTDGMALMQQAPKLKPDAIVLDIGMPLLNGLDAGRQLAKLLPRTKLVFLTMNAHPSMVVEAMQAGAAGFVVKHSAMSELTNCLLEVLKGSRYISPSIAGETKELLANRRRKAESVSTDLTFRQRQIVQLIAEGKTMKEIAVVLGISPRTVAEHKYHIMEILLVPSTAELVQYAIKKGLVAP